MKGTDVRRLRNHGVGSHSDRRSPRALAVGPRLGFLVTTVAVFAVLATGCASPHPTGLPKKTAMKSNDLKILSDVKLAKNHELIKDLEQLKQDISLELGLPEQKQQVVVYLFGDEKRYYEYLRTNYPQLPPRRAYFVGTSKELAVYTFWGDRVQEDLRHEYTHGILHATLKDVPLWLDEGLAEYFEIPGRPGQINPEYSQRLAKALQAGWHGDIDRLEHLETVAEMQRADYQESWAWVHFMLHHSDESRAVLMGYLSDLRHSKDAGSLASRLREDVPHTDDRFIAYVGSLKPGQPSEGTAFGIRQTAGIHQALGQQPD